MCFSILIAVYRNDSPTFFLEALDSVTNKQSVKPAEVVIVVDGPVNTEMNVALEQVASNNVKIVRLDKNCGLGTALAFGLSHCSHELVARMDSDDLSVANRFEHQLQAMAEDKDLDVIGGQIEEFDAVSGQLLGRRAVPLSPDEIRGRSRWRNPMNHMSVMFRKSSVTAAGSYRSMLFYEDYYLWLRLLAKGARLRNMGDVLVNVRAGDAMVKRRRGWENIKNEFRFFRVLSSERLLPGSTILLSFLLRLFCRILPPSIFSSLYQNYLRKKL